MSSQKEHPLIIGLTGNIATGKSSVMAALRELGADTIDADHVTHRLLAEDQEVHQLLVDTFGAGIIDEASGAVDRKALGALVFADPARLGQLETLLHPRIIAEVRRLIATSDSPVVVVEAIKLIESGMAETYDQIWVVTASPRTQMVRLMRDRGLSADEARLRIAAQPSPALKLSHADVVISNNGSLSRMQRQVERAFAALLADGSRRN